jgi:molybdopterin converting factor subunit 1
MDLQVLFFGVLTDHSGSASLNLTVTDDSTVASFREQVLQLYPGLKDQAHRIAVNEQFASEDQILSEGDEVAFLPPFAGG